MTHPTGRPRFGESAASKAWPEGWIFYHEPELPPFEFAELDLSAEQAEQVRQAAQFYCALKRSVPSKDATVARATKARHKLKVATARRRKAEKVATARRRKAEKVATARRRKAEKVPTEESKLAKAKAWQRAWRGALLRHDPKLVLDELGRHAAALAELLPSRGAAESVFNALQRKEIDPAELIALLHTVEGEATAAWERQRNKGRKPKAVAQFAFIGCLAEVYEAAGGEIGTVRDVPTIDGPEVLDRTELSDTPWARFLLAAFEYAGERPPSASTISRAVSEARREKR